MICTCEKQYSIEWRGQSKTHDDSTDLLNEIRGQAYGRIAEQPLKIMQINNDRNNVKKRWLICITVLALVPWAVTALMIECFPEARVFLGGLRR